MPSIVSTYEQIISSCTGAILTSFMMTPFDVVKTRLQAQNQPGYSAMYPQACTYCGGVSAEVCPSFPAEAKACVRPKFNGTMDAFVKISRAEGVHTLWRGLYPTLFMSVPATVIYFSTYDNLKGYFGTSALSPILAGSSARVVAATIISPIEMIRTKTQATAGSSSFFDVLGLVRKAVKAEGWGTMWRGLGPTLLRDVPFSAIYWFGYERMKQQYSQSHFGLSDHPVEVPFSVAFASGAISGTIAATITLPFDVIKTRQQSMVGHSDLGLAPVRETAREIYRDIYQNYGWRGFFVGLTPRLAKVAPACAIMISTYEFFKDFFRHRHDNENLDDPT